MTLAFRLLVAVGLMVVLTAAVVSIPVRLVARQLIEDDFNQRIEAGVEGVRQQLAAEAEALQTLLTPLCAHDTFVDKAQIALVRAKHEPQDPSSQDPFIGLPYQVEDQARAYHLDDLVVLAGNGRILGAADRGRIGSHDARLAALIQQPVGPPSLKPRAPGAPLAMEVHCALSGNGETVGVVGSRQIAAILKRTGHAFLVQLEPIDPADPVPKSDASWEVKVVDFGEVTGLKVAAKVPRAALQKALDEVSLWIGVTAAAALVLALVLASMLARNLSDPIEALARETREVMSGEPKHVRGRGGREIAALAEAFNKTMDDLTAMRKRVAATERIEARREVARQVAHEIKNPLAPIRAAVETLRRLRDRDDPAFDEYFEEATSTVLGEVRRITKIVDEFTRFNKMPAPTLEPIDLVQVARGVVTLHAAPPDHERSTPVPTRVELSSEPIPMVSADQNQIIQVLTNLIQNGLDAASAVRSDARVTVTIGPVPGERVRIVVRDNGPGVPEHFLPKLFEPYATTKEKGTGLGLAIVQRIVFEHGGEITYRKATKGGAVFEIVLPVAGPPLLARAPSTETTQKPA